MVGKLVVIGALGYLGYKVLRSDPGANGIEFSPADLRIAGGPLSSAATLQQSPDAPASASYP
jgi:hypothetical protein